MVAVLLSLLTLSLSCGSRAHWSDASSQYRLQHGALYQPLSEFQPSQQEWSHVYKIDLPTREDVIRMSSQEHTNELWESISSKHYNCDHRSNKLRAVVCLYRSTVLRQVRLLLNITTAELTDLRSTVGLVIRSWNSRAARGLEFLGDALSWLTNVPTGASFNKLKQQVAAYTGDQRRVNQQVFNKIDQMVSVENLLATRVQNMSDTWARELIKVVNISQTLYGDMIRALKGVVHFASFISAHEIARSEVQRFIARLRSAVLTLGNRQLDPFLIPPSVLHQSLRQVQRSLQAAHPTYEVLSFNPHDYYALRNINAWVRGDSLFMAIPIRVARRRRTFQVYHVTSIDLPIFGNATVSTHVDGLPEYFAVDVDGKQFVEMSSAEYLRCMVHADRLATCMAHLPVFSFQQRSCSLALFLEHSALIKAACTTRVVATAVNHHVREVAPGVLLLLNVKRVNLLCETGVAKTTDGCASCLLVLPCLCDVTIEQVVFTQRLERCSNTTQWHEVVNWHIISRMWSEDAAQALPDEEITFNVSSMPVLHELEKQFALAQPADQAFGLEIDAALDRARSQIENIPAVFDALPTLAEASPWMGLGSLTFSALIVAGCYCVCLMRKRRRGGSGAITSPWTLLTWKRPSTSGRHTDDKLQNDDGTAELQQLDVPTPEQ